MSKIYETVIGLEVHVELATKTKIFCGCSTAFGGAPNTHTCPVCTGMPGSLPVLNRQVVEYAMAVGIATNCSITQYCKFDRKNYFYPDNPQNYQISQLYLPICRNGGVEIETAAGKKIIGIHEIHMEEDAGKLVHDEWEDVSIVDYNRSGVPLIEIVSEPDMRSAEEVIAYLEKLRMIIQYLGASDCKLNEGSMRADVNLSVREAGAKKFGTRTEMKNLNSFKAIAHAIEGERERQIEVTAARFALPEGCGVELGILGEFRTVDFYGAGIRITVGPCDVSTLIGDADLIAGICFTAEISHTIDCGVTGPIGGVLQGEFAEGGLPLEVEGIGLLVGAVCQGERCRIAGIVVAHQKAEQ